MVFSSHLFLFYFLPLALLLYYAAPRRGKHVILTLLSYLFYGWANPAFVLLMFTSTIIDYVCGLIIARQFGCSWRAPVEQLARGATRSRSQRGALMVSICANLCLLGFFKYFNFAAGSYDAVVSALGLGNLRLDIWYRITLPLGISFYTFQSMSYSIDVYRGDAKAIRNFTDFACYVAMFPQLVAGPIIRFQELADQLESRRHTMEKFARGVAFVCLGLGKKVLLANPCGKVADMVFNAGSAEVLDAWYGVTAYAFQIYYDFSGYSDMAIGLGLMLGFVFPKNFDSPFHCESITDLWSRWHLSLSTWLRDYLYVPLGGNRGSSVRTYFNVAAVMVIGGLWHGASWNYVIWGGIHGTMLVLERLNGRRTVYRFLPRPARIAVTFVIIHFTWVFFRSPDLGAAVTFLGGMFGVTNVSSGAGLIAGLIYRPYYLLSFLAAATIVWASPQTWDFTRRLSWPKIAWIFVVLAAAIVALTTQGFNPFIYFIF
ncbi:MAG: MBOAT family protein [Lentisphaerae bacterium]|jgi:alginate O-acetyltransferase complex protein AlgI|nr:MBOAT family protein [Lentisphaerota bacterium]MBT5611148.1 MBOAT family protein [Lentisphaerota bacterium]MBT7054728.1 MBOAT family protein [Lentisphaerota bacterium]MBT7841986.1 MBOAT family protein [Lentisphaerota bacterium]